MLGEIAVVGYFVVTVGFFVSGLVLIYRSRGHYERHNLAMARGLKRRAKRKLWVGAILTGVPAVLFFASRLIVRL